MQNNTIWNNRIFECPFCKAMSTFSCIFSSKGHYKGIIYPISLWGCHHCDRGIFIKHQTTRWDHVAIGTLEIEQIYPSDEPFVNNLIPEGIAIDFIEATKCFNIAAYKASAVMSRRVIQKMCINLGATKEKKLFEQISELKVMGKLHPDLAEIASEIRFLGNDGAHPSNDGVDDIKQEDAKEILEFTNELLDDLYVRPQKVLAMKKKRESKGNSIK